MRHLRVLLCLVALAWCAASAKAEPASNNLAESVSAFLASLPPELRQQALLPFDDEERHFWHFFPMERRGVPLTSLDTKQRRLALEVLQAGLSESGFGRIETIRSLETILRDQEGGNTARDPDLYYLTVFGEPAADGTWALRYEGHHLSLHWTIVNGESVATSPAFLGANPADTESGVRALGDLEDMARKLVTSLEESQRSRVVISDRAPRDILTGAESAVDPLEPAGIPFSELSEQQGNALKELVVAYAMVHHPDMARQKLERVRAAGYDTIRFAWMGSLAKGQPHYYRIQGDTFLIEYDNIQNRANHIHSVWREFDGDFGRDLLKEHYAASPH